MNHKETTNQNARHFASAQQKSLSMSIVMPRNTLKCPQRSDRNDEREARNERIAGREEATSGTTHRYCTYERRRTNATLRAQQLANRMDPCGREHTGLVVGRTGHPAVT
jgi:hypothetical protein